MWLIEQYSKCLFALKNLAIFHTRAGSASAEGGTGGGGWVHPQGDMQMVAAMLTGGGL